MYMQDSLRHVIDCFERGILHRYHFANSWEKFMENVIVGIVSLLLFGYLFVAMLWPEKF